MVERVQYAFPMVTSFHPQMGIQADPGMTLRDYFAGQSLPLVLDQQMQNASEAVKVAFAGQVPPQKDMDEIGAYIRTQTAENCYRIADAMLAERTKATTP
jgi:hypothetical protein